ncbi:GntR family transcriptional regulator [Microbacterium sp. NPDC055683]
MDPTAIETVHERLSDHVYVRLSELIVDGVLPPGARIRDQDIATDLAVSRSPVREALFRLEREGLVRMSASRATVVTELTARDIAAAGVFLRGQVEVAASAAIARPGVLDAVGRLAARTSADPDSDLGPAAGIAWALHGVLAASADSLQRSVHSHLDASMRRILRAVVASDPAIVRGAVADLQLAASSGDPAQAHRSIQAILHLTRP